MRLCGSLLGVLYASCALLLLLCVLSPSLVDGAAVTLPKTKARIPATAIAVKAAQLMKAAHKEGAKSGAGSGPKATDPKGKEGAHGGSDGDSEEVARLQKVFTELAGLVSKGHFTSTKLSLFLSDSFRFLDAFQCPHQNQVHDVTGHYTALLATLKKAVPEADLLKRPVFQALKKMYDPATTAADFSAACTAFRREIDVDLALVRKELYGGGEAAGDHSPPPSPTSTPPSSPKGSGAPKTLPLSPTAKSTSTAKRTLFLETQSYLHASVGATVTVGSRKKVSSATQSASLGLSLAAYEALLSRISRDDIKHICDHLEMKSNEGIRHYYNRRAEQLANEIDRKATEMHWGDDIHGWHAKAMYAHEMRHEARLFARDCMALLGETGLSEVRDLHARDTEVYGNPDGPSFEMLVEKAKAKVLEKRAKKGTAGVLSENDLLTEAYKRIVHSAQTTNFWVNLWMNMRCCTQPHREYTVHELFGLVRSTHVYHASGEFASRSGGGSGGHGSGGVASHSPIHRGSPPPSPRARGGATTGHDHVEDMTAEDYDAYLDGIMIERVKGPSDPHVHGLGERKLVPWAATECTSAYCNAPRDGATPSTGSGGAVATGVATGGGSGTLTHRTTGATKTAKSGKDELKFL